MKHFRNLPLVLSLIAILLIATDLSSQEIHKTENGNLKIGKLINQTISKNSLENYRFLNRFVTKTGLVIGYLFFISFDFSF